MRVLAKLANSASIVKITANATTAGYATISRVSVTASLDTWENL